MSANEFVSLSVRPETRDRVRSAKRSGDSYDDVIRKMLTRFDPGPFGSDGGEQ